MELKFKHKGLAAFAASGDKSGIHPKHAERVAFILKELSAATSIKDIETVKGLHPINQRRAKTRNRFAMDVSGAWRITFTVGESVEGSFENLNYVNYH